MKARPHHLAVAIAAIAAVIWWFQPGPEPTLLSFRPGQAFEGVAKDSTFPVLTKSNIPDSDTG
jgi:hypothetical protein